MADFWPVILRWMPSLLLVGLLALVIWKREPLRRWSREKLFCLAGKCVAADEICQVWVERWKLRADEAIKICQRYEATLRAQLAVLDYQRLAIERWHTVEKLCQKSDKLLDRAQHDLEQTYIPLPEQTEWTGLADYLSKLPAESSRKINYKIQEALVALGEAQHAEAMREYRWAVAMRGRALLASARYWQMLKARMADISQYGRELVEAESQIIKSSKFLAKASSRDNGPAVPRILLRNIAQLALLFLTIWLSIFVYSTQIDSSRKLVVEGVMTPQFAVVWPVLYLAGLLVGGALFLSAVRVSSLLPQVAELNARWRAWIAGLCVFPVVIVGIGTMQIVVTEMRPGMVEAGWSESLAWLVSGLLYLLPLIIAVQPWLLERWVRFARPLICLALSSSCRVLSILVRGVGYVSSALRKHISPALVDISGAEQQGSPKS